jgi:hypothetical protein
MLTDGTLEVADERRVRGTVEKSYAVAVDLGADARRVVMENDGKGYLQLFMSYSMGIMSEFKAYSEREGIDILKDGSGFTVAPVYATTAELHSALEKVGETLRSLYKNEQTAERRLHNICIITTPPQSS